MHYLNNNLINNYHILYNNYQMFNNNYHMHKIHYPNHIINGEINILHYHYMLGINQLINHHN